MTDFCTSELDAVIKKIRAYRQAVETAIPEMLTAGAEVLVQTQKEEMESMGIRQMKNSGDTIDSIKAYKLKKDKEGNSYIDVYPKGKNRRGERNAEVAFKLEYGTSKSPAYPWMRMANVKSLDELKAKEIEIWNKHKGE